MLEESLLQWDKYEQCNRSGKSKGTSKIREPHPKVPGDHGNRRGEAEAIDGDRPVSKPTGLGVNEYLLYHLLAS